MSASNQLAGYLPYVLGAILVGFALCGNFLPASTRSRIERQVLPPLYLVVALATLALTLREHNWLLTGIAAMATLYVALSVYRRLRPAQRGAGT